MKETMPDMTEQQDITLSGRHVSRRRVGMIMKTMALVTKDLTFADDFNW